MKLVIKARCEQGTPNGAMVFRPGSYAVAENEAGYLVSHEPRERRVTVMRDGQKVKETVIETETQVSAEVMDKLTSFDFAELEN